MPDALSVPAPQTSTAPAADPNAGTASTASTDGAGTPKALESTALFEKLQRASAGAVEQHLGETKKRKPGERGPDKNPGARPPRKPRGLSAPPLGESSSEPLLEEAAPVPLAPVVVEAPPFDEALAREVVTTVRELMNDCASAVVRVVAKKETGDRALADEAANEVRMSEKLAGAFDRSGVLVAKKHNLSMTYAPEGLLLACLLSWGKQVRGTVGALREKGNELRERAQRQQQPDPV